MDKFAADVIEKVHNHLNEDLLRHNLIQTPTKEPQAQTKQKYLAFVKYLVSVVTHPIGLRASVSPLNSSQEHMLAYLMDMFKLTDRDINSMLVGGQTDPSSKQTIDQTRSLKRHSWRPELRIRIRPPNFFHKQQLLLSNLNVRVYLFKPEQKSATTESNRNPTPVKHLLSNGKGALDKIFQSFQPESSILIRPVNEVRTMFKFEPCEMEDGNRPSAYRMHQVESFRGDKSIADISRGELRIHIRRYYCEPKSVHILRFEFWINSEAKQSGCFNPCRRCLKQLVYNGNCCSGGKRSTYMNERQEFYGYINIKLTQLPAYPIKTIYPLLTLKERQVNSCEISLEPRNRKLIRTKWEHRFLVDHMRLYINCILYQILSLGSTQNASHITIDNLFYLPAYSIINQHRLQCNLTLFEDNCCKRVSILLLLMRLELQEPSDDSIKRILISAAQNEYMIGYRNVEAFDDDSNGESSRLGMISVELTTLKEYYFKFLSYQLRSWFSRLGTGNRETGIRQPLELSSLKLFRLALSHMRKSHRTMGLLQEEVTFLKKSLEQLLCKLILRFLSARLMEVFNKDKSVRSPRIIRLKQTTTRQYSMDANPWQDLLRQIKHINHDLSSHWSRKGINGLIEKHHEYVKQSSAINRKEEQNFRKILVADVHNLCGPDF